MRLMANADITYSKPTPGFRPLIGGHREPLPEEPAPRFPPPRTERRFPRLESGQLLRALLLIVACLGLSRIPQPEKAQAITTVVAPKPM
ncbi:MAG: hypothetical protein CTY15_11060 [Methylocystis sp.]|nr:MAG: hypothetical protein CTY15_11060 [Methylocystis sp.]